MEKQRTIKVLHVVNNLGAGGIEKLLYDLVTNLPTDPFSIEICCVRERAGVWLEPIEDLNIPVHFLGNYRKNPFRFFYCYRQLLVRSRYTAVHVHLNHLSGLFLNQPAHLTVPIRIAHYHNDFSRFNPASLKQRLRRYLRCMTDRYATVNIGISDMCLDSIYPGGWKNKSNVLRIYNGVDLKKFAFCETSRLDLRKQFGIDEKTILIGHVGRFRPQKNHDFLVDLAEQLHRRFAKFVFLLVGDGPLLDHIVKTVTMKGLQNHFVFAGLRKDVPGLLSAMDIFVLPSLWEGFGLTVIEAQAAGLPVIASDNLPEEIPLLDRSERISTNDISAWGGKIEDLAAESVLQKGQQRKAPGHELLEFSLPRWIESMASLYSHESQKDKK